jgi:HAD superfamily hydrolase (TIGR01484 family)
MGSMRHRVLACDYDGTLATEGVISPAVVASLERISQSGIRLILVTGRTREELEGVFDPGHLFAALVIENGAVVIDSSGGEETLLAPRLPRALVEELRCAGVSPW